MSKRTPPPFYDPAIICLIPGAMLAGIYGGLFVCRLLGYY